MKLNKWKVLELMIAKRIENQAELAKRIGVTRQALSNWMSGISFPSGDSLAALCGELGCTLDAIVELPLPKTDAPAILGLTSILATPIQAMA